VTATFVAFQPEGYNAAGLPGRPPHQRADVHMLYVHYRVGEDNIILPAVPGGTYPPTVTLYRN